MNLVAVYEEALKAVTGPSSLLLFDLGGGRWAAFGATVSSPALYERRKWLKPDDRGATVGHPDRYPSVFLTNRPGFSCLFVIGHRGQAHLLAQGFSLVYMRVPDAARAASEQVWAAQVAAHPKFRWFTGDDELPASPPEWGELPPRPVQMSLWGE